MHDKVENMKLMDEKLHCAKQLNLHTCTKQEFLDYLENGWRVYEIVMGSLKAEEDYYIPPNPLRRPLIFYLGHTSSFFINKLILAGAITEKERVNERFEQIFAVGVDEMSWDDMNEDHFDWPTLSEVWEYRNNVKKLIYDLVEKTEWNLPIHWDKHPLWALVMGCEHERIHLETSSVLIRETNIERVKKPEGWVYASTNGIAPANEMILIDPKKLYENLPGKISPKIRLGKTLSYPGYGWDNEYGNEIVPFEKSFEVSKFKITNGEFLQFINAKGYETREYWDEEGWNWRNYKTTTHPHFWVPLDASKYRFRVMYDIIEMPWDWPVEVNYLEAKAYCRWKGSQYSLVTEDQFTFLVQTNMLLEAKLKSQSVEELQQKIITGNDDVIQYDPAFQTDTKTKYNFDFIIGSSNPIDQFPPNQLGIYDQFGNVWEWGESYFKPRRGFQVHPIYYDFSTPCFDDKHNMILGGSWASTGNETSSYARYAFRRHFFQHAGFRLVKNPDSRNLSDLPHVHDLSLRSDYFFTSYLENIQSLLKDDSLLKFYSHIAHRISHLIEEKGGVSIGVIGSRVGRICFELSRYFDNITGFDFAGFIDICHRMRKNNNVIEFNDKKFNFETANEVKFSAVEFSPIDENYEINTDKKFDILILFDITFDKLSYIKLLNQISNLTRLNSHIVIVSSYDWSNDEEEDEGRMIVSNILCGMKYKVCDQFDLNYFNIHSARNINLSLKQISFWVPESETPN